MEGQSLPPKSGQLLVQRHFLCTWSHELPVFPRPLQVETFGRNTLVSAAVGRIFSWETRFYRTPSRSPAGEAEVQAKAPRPWDDIFGILSRMTDRILESPMSSIQTIYFNGINLSSFIIYFACGEKTYDHHDNHLTDMMLPTWSCTRWP